MDAKEKVLATMKEAGQPLNAGKIGNKNCFKCCKQNQERRKNDYA